MGQRKTFSATAEVEVHLSDFDIDDILEYVKDQGHDVDREDTLRTCSDTELLDEADTRELTTLDYEFGDQIGSIHQALKLGQDDKALALTRTMIKAHTGCAVI